MRSFQDTLTDLDEGKVHENLTEQLARLVQAVGETNKAGQLTLTIAVKKEGGMMVVNHKLAVKLPQPQANATMFYASADGELMRDDPRQLPLRNVKKQAAEALRTPKQEA